MVDTWMTLEIALARPRVVSWDRISDAAKSAMRLKNSTIAITFGEVTYCNKQGNNLTVNNTNKSTYLARPNVRPPNRSLIDRSIVNRSIVFASYSFVHSLSVIVHYLACPSFTCWLVRWFTNPEFKSGNKLDLLIEIPSSKIEKRYVVVTRCWKTFRQKSSQLVILFCVFLLDISVYSVPWKGNSLPHMLKTSCARF